MERTEIIRHGDTDDVFALGKVFQASGFFADCRDENQAVVKILAGRELGIPAFQSMSGIHVVKGKATLGAALIAGRIKGSGKYTYRVKRMDDQCCTLEFFEGGESIGMSKFDESDARRAGTQNMGKFPRNMLFARAISNGAKWYTPDVFNGPIYTPDELGSSIEPDPAPQQEAETPRRVAVEVVSVEPTDPVDLWREDEASDETKKLYDAIRRRLKLLGDHTEGRGDPARFLAWAQANLKDAKGGVYTVGDLYATTTPGVLGAMVGALTTFCENIGIKVERDGERDGEKNGKTGQPEADPITGLRRHVKAAADVRAAVTELLELGVWLDRDWRGYLEKGWGAQDLTGVPSKDYGEIAADLEKKKPTVDAAATEEHAPFLS